MDIRRTVRFGFGSLAGWKQAGSLGVHYTKNLYLYNPSVTALKLSQGRAGGVVGKGGGEGVVEEEGEGEREREMY